MSNARPRHQARLAARQSTSKNVPHATASAARVMDQRRLQYARKAGRLPAWSTLRVRARLSPASGFA